jgi:hypothetical protein
VRLIVVGLLAIVLAAGAAQAAALCVDCHKGVTPNIVKDWELSLHASQDVGCETCHGSDHDSADNAGEAEVPVPELCATCHEDQFEQFERGKHALAWAAMKAMPTTHWQPMELIDGMKGCGGCHKIGIKSPEEIRKLKEEGSGFGLASCDACHTRHLFSAEEARQPEACRTCHMGFDHPQWEMYSSSKHGVRHTLKKTGHVPREAAAPTCQTCHMQAGNHEVRTAWGFLAVRLPMPEDEQWAADRATILQALGVLDPEGQPTDRLEVVKAADVARLDQASWQAERDKMLDTCNDCHSRNFAKAELDKGDGMIKAADRLMAEAIREIAALYRDGVLAKPRATPTPSRTC